MVYIVFVNIFDGVVGRLSGGIFIVKYLGLFKDVVGRYDCVIYYCIMNKSGI